MSAGPGYSTWTRSALLVVVNHECRHRPKMCPGFVSVAGSAGPGKPGMFALLFAGAGVVAVPAGAVVPAETTGGVAIIALPWSELHAVAVESAAATARVTRRMPV